MPAKGKISVGSASPNIPSIALGMLESYPSLVLAHVLGLIKLISTAETNRRTLTWSKYLSRLAEGEDWLDRLRPGAFVAKSWLLGLAYNTSKYLS